MYPQSLPLYLGTSRDSVIIRFLSSVLYNFSLSIRGQVLFKCIRHTYFVFIKALYAQCLEFEFSR